MMGKFKKCQQNGHVLPQGFFKNHGDDVSDIRYSIVENIIKSFSSVGRIGYHDQNLFCLIDITHLFGKYAMPWLRTFVSLINQHLQLKSNLVSDGKTVSPGDVLYISGLNYVIVKNAFATSESKDDQLNVKIVYVSTDGFLTTKRLKMESFTLIPNASRIFVTKTKDRKLTTSIALREVGEVCSTRSFFEIELLESASLMYPTIPCSKSRDIQLGAMVSFTYSGQLYQGIVVKKRNYSNNCIKLSYIHVNRDGIVSEDTKSYDLNKVRVERCSYMDLDSVIRPRLLYTAEKMKGSYICPNIFTRSLAFVLGCMTGDIVFSKKLPIFIKFQPLSLPPTAFPRIRNLETWMTKNACLNIPETIIGEVRNICLTTTVFIISHKYKPSDTYFDMETVLKPKEEVFSTPEIAAEKIETKLKECSGIVIFILELNPDENGQIPEMEKQILLSMKAILNQYDIIYTIPHAADMDLRLKTSECVRTVIQPDEPINNLFHCLFFQTDSDIEKRVSLYAERSVNTQIRRCSDYLNVLKKATLITDKEEIYTEEIEMFRQSMNKLQSFIGDNQLDICDRHTIEVILQRHEDAPAYSVKDGKLHVFSNNCHYVKQYLQRFLPDDLMKFVEFKNWPGEPKTTLCNIKQGNKIIKTNAGQQNYGTIGFFLRDDDDNIYLTTCAHVIRKGEVAFIESQAGETTIGQSVFSPTGQPLNLIEDLSIIKVLEDKVDDCKFGLRNTTDNMVQGSISVADVCEMENKKVYKWGATTQLTRGIYKCSMFLKQGEKYENNFHFIEGNSHTEIFAEEGDSGALVCFEATDSPQFQEDTAAFIFVGKFENQEVVSQEAFKATCYHVNKVFRCEVKRNFGELVPLLTPRDAENI